MALLKITEEVLRKYGENAVSQMKKNAAPYKASGRMERGFRYQIDPFGMRIYGVDYLQWYEQGRGKTKTSAAGTPTLKETIQEWIKIKPVPIWEGYTIESMAFVIARKIHKQGVSWHKKSVRNIYSNVITKDSINKLRETLAKFQAIEVTSQINRLAKKSLR